MEFSNERAIAYRPFTYVSVKVNLLQYVKHSMAFGKSTQDYKNRQ